MQLNLPQYTFNYRDNRGELEIFCILRKKWLVLTPEEYVRQHVIRYLNEFQGIAYHTMMSEVAITFPGGVSRADIVVYNANGSVLGIVECKAPQVQIDDNVLQQANRYHYGLGSQWILLTNGLKHVVFQDEGWKEGWPEKMK